MTVPRPCLVVAAAVLAGASAAHAQLAPDRAGTSSAPTEATEDEYWSFMRELGRCLAETKTELSVALMQTAVDTPEEARAFRALFNPRSNVCMRNMVQATVIRAQVRGVIAESLYEAAQQAAPASPPSDARGADPVRSIHDFADCYVASHHAEARALLADTRLATRAEHERVREMSANFGPCLPEGREVRIVPIDIRLALAEALYRRATGRPTSVQGSQ